MISILSVATVHATGIAAMLRTQNGVPEASSPKPITQQGSRQWTVTNIWQFMRENWLSNRVFQSYKQIIALCCEAWNKLVDQPWRIMSIGMREWAYR